MQLLMVCQCLEYQGADQTQLLHIYLPVRLPSVYMLLDLEHTWKARNKSAFTRLSISSIIRILSLWIQGRTYVRNASSFDMQPMRSEKDKQDILDSWFKHIELAKCECDFCSLCIARANSDSTALTRNYDI